MLLLDGADDGKVSIADSCLVQYKFNTIGLVDDTKSDPNIAEEIYKIVENKMLSNQSSKFQPKQFASVEELDTY